MTERRESWHTQAMGWRLNVFFALSLSTAPLLSCTCEDRDEPVAGGGVGVNVRTPKQADTSKQPTPSEAAAARPEPQPDPPPQEEEKASEEEGDAGASPPTGPLTTEWQLGQVADVGPAAPMTATANGIVLISKNDRAHLAQRKEGGGFDAIHAPTEAFARYGRGPAVPSAYAYWVSPRSMLMRGKPGADTAETLADEARFGARVSALRAAERDVVTYIRGTGDETLAYLWAEGIGGRAHENVRLSEEGTTATSATLVRGTPHPRVMILEGRSSMSPIHLRTVRVTQRRVTLLSDRVVWVGPGSHSLTELVSLDRPSGRMTALLASAKDITHFGLAQLLVNPESEEVPSAHWRTYPNGLDPAPVAAEHLCGKDYALFAIPSHAKPRSPQELRIAELAPTGLENEEIIAHSRAFNDVSVAPIQGGAVVSWTADSRTWALTLGCPDG